MEIAILPKCNWLSKNGYALDEEEEIYEMQLQDIIDNPRWYLDNLESMTEYKLSWIRYTRKSISLPLRHIQHIEKKSIINESSPVKVNR